MLKAVLNVRSPNYKRAKKKKLCYLTSKCPFCIHFTTLWELQFCNQRDDRSNRVLNDVGSDRRKIRATGAIKVTNKDNMAQSAEEIIGD